MIRKSFRGGGLVLLEDGVQKGIAESLDFVDTSGVQFALTLGGTEIEVRGNASGSSLGQVILATPGLTDFFALDEEVGATHFENDKTAARRATVIGTPTLHEPGGVLGGESFAALFAGASNFAVDDEADVTLTNFATGTQPFSIECMVYHTMALTGGNVYGVWSLCKLGGIGTDEVTLRVSDNGLITCLRNGITTVSGFKATPGAWTHLTVTYDGANLRLYRNGALTDTIATVIARGAGNDHLLIGTGEDANGLHRRFQGKIQNVGVYNVALSAFTIATHFVNSGAAVDPRVRAVRTIGATTALSVAADDDVLVTATSTITLPLVAAAAGRYFRIKNTGAGAVVTVAAAGVEIIDGTGSGTVVLGTRWQSVTLFSDGTAWFIVGITGPKAAALTAINAAAIDAVYDAVEQGVLNNVRTRLNEVETALKALNLLA